MQPCWYYATTSTPLAANTACTGTATAANVLDLKYNFGFGTSATTPNTDCTVLPSGITKNWGETFTIDPWGNLTNRTVSKCSAEPLSVVALNNNRLSGFGYDADGTMTSNGGASYTYTAESRLKTAGGVTYTYDGDGERVKKSNGTLYWGGGSGDDTTLESDLSGNLQREFIFAGGKRVARRDISSGSVYYYLSDLLGSADVVTNATGGIQNESDYYPYGGERVYSQTLTDQNYKFTGKERDAESGLDNFGARFDSSNLGRFMTPDWVARPTAVPYAVFGDPQSLNLYGYVRNDPVSRADDDGHTSAMPITDIDCGSTLCSTTPEAAAGSNAPAAVGAVATSEATTETMAGSAETLGPFPMDTGIPGLSSTEMLRASTRFLPCAVSKDRSFPIRSTSLLDTSYWVTRALACWINRMVKERHVKSRIS